MESAVTPLIRLSFEICNKLYKYWPPYFLACDLSSRLPRLKFVSNHFLLAPWYSIQFFIYLLSGMGSIVYVLISELRSPIPTIPIVNTFIILWGGLITLFMFVLLIITRNYHKYLVHAFNRMLEEEEAIITEIKEIVPNNPPPHLNLMLPAGHGMLEFLMCTVPFAGLLAMIFSVFLIVPLNIDPLHYVAQRLFLPHPYYQTLEHIITSFLIRSAIGLIWVIEMSRQATISGLQLITTGLVSNSMLSKLECGILPNSRMIIHYARLRIIWQTANWISDSVILVSTVYGQMITTLTICFGIRANDKFPLILSFMFALLAFGLVCTTVIFLTLAGSAVDKGEKFIENNRQRALVQKGMRSLCYKRWRAQQPSKLKCGSLFAFKKRTTFTYMEVLVNNVINGLLIVK